MPTKDTKTACFLAFLHLARSSGTFSSTGFTNLSSIFTKFSGKFSITSEEAMVFTEQILLDVTLKNLIPRKNQAFQTLQFENNQKLVPTLRVN